MKVDRTSRLIVAKRNKICFSQLVLVDCCQYLSIHHFRGVVKIEIRKNLLETCLIYNQTDVDCLGQIQQELDCELPFMRRKDKYSPECTERNALQCKPQT